MLDHVFEHVLERNIATVQFAASSQFLVYLVGDLLVVRQLRLDQAFRNLAQKHAGFACRVEEGGVLVSPDLFWKHIQHLIDHLWRREYLVVGEVGKAAQHIRVVGRREKITHSSSPRRSS